jgi:hypothetical protein
MYLPVSYVSTFVTARTLCFRRKDRKKWKMKFVLAVGLWPEAQSHAKLGYEMKTAGRPGESALR